MPQRWLPLAAAIVFAGCTRAASTAPASSAPASSAPASSAPASTAYASSAPASNTYASSGDIYVDMYRKLKPSMVLFTMDIPADDPKRKGAYDEAYGSGIVVESGDWGSRILTDAHVVQDARHIMARIGDRRKVAARVVAVSNDRDDVAILETAIRRVPIVALGTSKGLEAGRPIGVMGYPIPDAFEDEHLGTKVSIYAGRIASVRDGSLELDVPIIPGESGGPVFEAAGGTIVGIAESRFDEERAIGFATPIDIAVKFLSAHQHR